MSRWMTHYEGKTVYITGAASGLGFETARQLITMGAQLVLFDIQPLEQAKAALTRLSTANMPVITYALDVTDSERTLAQFATAAQHDPPDILMHFAGVTGPWSFDEMSAAQFEQVMRVNVFGVRHVLAAIRPFLSRGDQVVVAASMASFVGSYGYSSYSAAKFAVWGLLQSLRYEWQPLGIDITVFAPPAIDTPLTQAEVGVMDQAGVSMKKLAGELDVAPAITTLLKGVSARQFLVVPGVMANLIRLQLRLFPVRWVNWIGDTVVALTNRHKQ